MSEPKTAVLQVVVVKTNDAPAYLLELEKGKELMKKFGVKAQVRVWHATFAGPDAGSIIVGLEFPDIAKFAEAAKLLTDKNYLAWLKGMDKVRTVLSDSLFREL